MKSGIFPILLTLAVLLASCSSNDKQGNQTYEEPAKLNLTQASQLAELPLVCMQTEYPNKMGQVLGSKEDLGEPGVLHPAFYGCFDWHSSVHGHWSLVKLLKTMPRIEQEARIRENLLENLSPENILAELDYFQREHSSSFERTYGWAWLLKLAEELHTWDDPMGQTLEKNLQPLTDLIVQRYIDFLPRLNYPIRVGEHTNTAFGLCFAWDYAVSCKNQELKSLIESRSRAFYLDDLDCPLTWEPSGYDFLSPCLEEVDLMRRILDEDDFMEWLDLFMPRIKSKDFNMDPGIVSDRTDGKLVHLDGLNFSRAWVLYGLAAQYPEFNHLIDIANKHLEHSLPNLVGDDYEGGHWLGSFAIYALLN